MTTRSSKFSWRLSIALCSLLSLTAQPTRAQERHTLKPTPETVAWGCDDAKAELVFSPSHK